MGVKITEESDLKLEALLDYLKRTRSFDFTGYKRSSLTRRTLKRMEIIGVKDFIDYVDYLEVHPEEFSHLFNTILINVTSFFRDEDAWKYLASTIIPNLIRQHKNGQPYRIWDAGCASGEEAYSMAMLFCEALGFDKFQSDVKICRLSSPYERTLFRCVVGTAGGYRSRWHSSHGESASPLAFWTYTFRYRAPT